MLALYGAGLDRIVETIVDPRTRAPVADDELVGPLLVLHDLHPDDVDTRVQRALDRVRPYLGSHAGGVALSGVDEEGVVHLQLEGSCDGCPSSALTVKNAIEDAILTPRRTSWPSRPRAWSSQRPRAAADPAVPPRERGRGHVARLAASGSLDVPPRTMSRIEAGGESVLVANLDGTLVAYLDRCPACVTRCPDGHLTGDVLTCTCGTSYDVRLAGRALATVLPRWSRCRCCPSTRAGRPSALPARRAA